MEAQVTDNLATLVIMNACAIDKTMKNRDRFARRRRWDVRFTLPCAGPGFRPAGRGMNAEDRDEIASMFGAHRVDLQHRGQNLQERPRSCWLRGGSRHRFKWVGTRACGWADTVETNCCNSKGYKFLSWKPGNGTRRICAFRETTVVSCPAGTPSASARER